jgi:hypothetical protein
MRSPVVRGMSAVGVDEAEYDRLNSGYFRRLNLLIQSPFLLLAFRWLNVSFDTFLPTRRL